MRLHLLLLSMVLVLLGACDTRDTADTQPTTVPPATETTAPATTTTSTTTSTTTTVPPTTTTTSATTTTSGEDGAPELTARCDSPEGYSISYPETWSTNPGEVVPECGQFDPESFDVPEGTDERVAAITAYIDPVPFTQVAAPADERAAFRAVTAIDGLQTVRLEYETQEDGFWPAGTPIALYAVDVSTEEENRTLLLDTVGTSGFDYEENRRILDRMARSLDIHMEGVRDDPAVVARYGGGGGAFSVEARVSGEEACLRIVPEGERVCTDLPAADQLHTVQLENLDPVLAGVTGEQVFAVTAELRDGTTSTVLPAPIEDSETKGFSFTVGLEEIQQFVLTDLEGEELRTIRPGG